MYFLYHDDKLVVYGVYIDSSIADGVDMVAISSQLALARASWLALAGLPPW